MPFDFIIIVKTRMLLFYLFLWEIRTISNNCFW